jgi:uncharacterized iron-regulated membrane protein
VGVGLLPIWFLLAFTSVYLNFPRLVRAATATFSTITAVPTRSAPRIAQPTATADDALAAALAYAYGAKPFGISRDFVHGWYSVRLVLPGDINPSGNSQVYVDFSTGAVVAARLATAATAGDRFIFWQFPLHSGEAFGVAGKAAISAAAMALAVMCGTGLYVWWRGWIVRRRRVETHR